MESSSPNWLGEDSDILWEIDIVVLDIMHLLFQSPVTFFFFLVFLGLLTRKPEGSSLVIGQTVINTKVLNL